MCPDDDSFAALFEQQSKETFVRRKLPRVGEALDVRVVQVGKDTIFVELDGKRQGYVDAIDFQTPAGTPAIAVGETIRVHVLAVDNESGEVKLGRSFGRPGHLDTVVRAKEAGAPVEGKVLKTNKGGLEVDLGGVRAFCPVSQIDSRYVQDPNAYVGKTLEFLVTEVKDGGKSVLVSRRALLDRGAKEASEKIVGTLAVGTAVTGTVTGIREFGAFVDLGGVEGLIPASEVSHARGTAIANVLNVGDTVRVQVLEIKKSEPKKAGQSGLRITLSLKSLAEDPWDAAGELFKPGQVVVGQVSRLADFGAFVKLSNGLDGLIHNSELDARTKLTVGETVSVVVKGVDQEKKRIGLIPAPEGKKAGSVVTTPTFTVGSVVTGTIEKIEPYGVFVRVEGTTGRAGRGLIPNAELGVPRGTDVRKTFPEGTKVTAKVLETAEGRLRLSLRAAKDAEERAEFEGFREASKAPHALGTLGDLLKKRQR